MNLRAHTYTTAGFSTKKFTDLDKAKKFCYRQFEKNNVYKVKLWDLDKGSIEVGNPKARALILHLV